MKSASLLIISFLFFQFTSLAQDRWHWLNPLPQGNDLNDVFVLDENTIIAVGYRGTLLRSENGGEDWNITYRLSNIEEDIVDIEFISEQKGYLLANKYRRETLYNSTNYPSKILLTEDSGITWEVISEFDSLRMNDLFFIDENVGWAIGYCGDMVGLFTGQIFKTTDGGHIWKRVYSETITTDIVNLSIPFSKIQFIDNRIGWATGKPDSLWTGVGELLRTEDGGITWDPICQSISILVDFQFLNKDTGYLRENKFQWFFVEWSVKKTTDGGINWVNVAHGVMGEDESYLRPLYFINPDTGWVKVPGQIGKTTNGGISWTVINQGAPNDGAIHFNDEFNGCIVGDNGGILTTQDGGQNWIVRSSTPISGPLIGVDFYNNDIGWVSSWYYGEINFGGIIFKTSDGGISWEGQLNILGGHQYAGIINDLQSINDQIIYAVGCSVYKSTNSGTTWETLDQPVSSCYKTLFFLNEEIGLVGKGFSDFPNGDFGFGLYKTTNGGMEWDSVFPGAIESIFFTNSSTGWLIRVGWFGGGNWIYKTTDQGNTWEEIWVSSTGLRSICFADENLGLAVGNDGVIIRTTNGGFDWEEIFNLEGYEFNSVGFVDSSKAIVVGHETRDPSILQQIDGIILTIDDVNGFYSIKWQSWTPGLNDFCYKNNTGWAVGEGGTIIKTGEGVSSINEEEINEIPSNYFLSNNYPNPFNPNTKIRYSIPQASKVTIKVFGILGNEIETLVNEEKPAGTYELTWNAVNLPSGVYFYQLRATPIGGQAGDFIQTKKMILLK